MNIYTKVGDKGKTSLIGGKRVEKCCDRLESYGTIDELNSHIGLVFDTCNDEPMRKILSKVQQHLFTIGSQLACENPEEFRLTKVDETHIQFLEQSIDNFAQNLPQLKEFILPAGHSVASQCHIARTVCRRAERCIVRLNEVEQINVNIMVYINRLSDLLFVMARRIIKNNNLQEVTWGKE